MNQTHPLYLRSDSPQDDGSSHLDVLTSQGRDVTTFQQLSNYHTQTTTYYSHAPTTYVSSSFGHDRKEYGSPTIHGLTPVRLPSLGCGPSSNDMHLSVGSFRQHPAAVQADQMNAFMESEFFVDPDQGTSRTHPDHQDLDVIVDDDGLMGHHDHLGKEVMSMDSHDDMMDLEEEEKRHRNNEMARLRYHNMPNDQKRQVNSRRAEMIKKKRQDEKERRELEDILRRTNDVQDPQVAEEIKKQQVRARRAESARSRYQRMSMAERKEYNYRRRLKAMGVDPDVAKDPSLVKATIAKANEKKAAAARDRYHRMSSEERREYNMKRTETFRKRRMEEEVLLSTPAGRISQEALAKAQQIMVRNAKKAEAARIRYQRMTPDQRKEYNIRRAQSKRERSRHLNNDSRSSHEHMGDCTLHDDSSGSDDISGSEMDLSFTSEPPSNILEPGRDIDVVGDGMHQQAPPPSTSRNANDEIFHQMEQEVIKKTQQAHRALNERQMKIIEHQQMNSTQHSQQHLYIQNHMDDQLGGDDGSMMMQEQMMENDKMVYQEGNQIIDDKMLAEMVMTGRDGNGMPVEIRTVDGRVIRDERELRELIQDQMIIIQPSDGTGLEHKDTIYANGGDDQLMTPSTSSQDSMYTNAMPHQQQSQLHHHSHHDHYEEVVEPEDQMELRMSSQRGGQNQQMNDQPINAAERQQLCKQRRAERARIRYHQMQPEIRQAQNARRAELLRKSRQRDEQLMQLAESVDVVTLPDETQKAIEEARLRRERRAEQARAKYHRMNSEERRQYNAMRDAQRRQRKRQQEAANPESASGNASGRHRGGPAHHIIASASQLDNSSLNDEDSNGPLSQQNEHVEEEVIFNYDSFGYPPWEGDPLP